MEEGYTQREIAKELGIDRRTVYRWTKNGDLDRELTPATVKYGPRPTVPKKLDPYKAIIEDRLDEYPELAAIRLLEEIRAAGGGCVERFVEQGGEREVRWCSRLSVTF